MTTLLEATRRMLEKSAGMSTEKMAAELEKLDVRTLTADASIAGVLFVEIVERHLAAQERCAAALERVADVMESETDLTTLHAFKHGRSM